MARRDNRKTQALAASRTLNPHPEKVTDPAFGAGGFFDPADLVQVKYEMVRKAQAHDVSVAAAAAAFGFSRQSLYSAKTALDEQGLAGLVPAKPGPQGGHKLTDQVMEYLEELAAADPRPRPADLAAAAGRRFGVCQNEGIRDAQPICQHLSGAPLDSAVADLILTTLTPLALEVALTVTDELLQHAQHADSLRAAHVTRAQQAADQARRRYLAVDPDNRLVADTLEADWNARLRELATAHDDYTNATTGTALLDERQRTRIRALAADFPTLWNDPATPMRERKRLIRLLVTDVTLTRGPDTITAAIRFPGGGHHVLRLPVPRNAWQLRKTPDDVIELIDQLLEYHTYAQIADILNARQAPHGGIASPWTGGHIASYCHERHLRSRHQRLRDHGLLTLTEAAARLAAHPQSIKRWHKLGLITGEQADDRGIFLYHPDQTRPTWAQVEDAGHQLGDPHRSGRRNPHRVTGRPRNVRRTRDNTKTTTT